MKLKNNLVWYSHDVAAHNNMKFKMLRLLYFKAFGVDGWAGEGRFWALNNLVAGSHNCQLECTSPLKRLSIATELSFTPDELSRFLEILIECDLIDKGLYEAGYLQTERTQECLWSLQDNREKTRERNKKYREKNKEGQKLTRHAPKNDASQQSELRVTGSENSVTGPEKPRHQTHSTVQYSTVHNGNTIVLPPAASAGDGGKKRDELVKEQPNSQQPQDAAPPAQPPNKAKKTPRSSNKEGVTPYWEEMKSIYENFRARNKLSKATWAVKAETKSMKEILKVLKGITETEDHEEWNLINASLKWEHFLSTAYVTSEWLKKNFRLANLYSQIDPILSHAKNPINGTSTISTSNGQPQLNGNGQKLGTSASRVEALKNF